MNIRMATLDFFCNRPTVVAIIDFGSELSEVMDMDSAASKSSGGLPSVSSGEALSIETLETSERHIVKGLLGRGKSRVVFRLRMDMESARIYLNKEDGSQLAMLAQEKFMMDLRVSSIAVRWEVVGRQKFASVMSARVTRIVPECNFSDKTLFVS